MPQQKVDIQLAADYICFKGIEAGDLLSVLKLHKLLYYAQAWHLAFFSEPIFDENFEAWVHGPVNMRVFKRFVDTKTMYSPINIEDLVSRDFAAIPANLRDHIDNVLDSYMPLSGSQLEQLTHQEDPWIRARGNLSPFERCNAVIENSVMLSYYRAKANAL